MIPTVRVVCEDSEGVPPSWIRMDSTTMLPRSGLVRLPVTRTIPVLEPMANTLYGSPEREYVI